MILHQKQRHTLPLQEIQIESNKDIKKCNLIVSTTRRALPPTSSKLLGFTKFSMKLLAIAFANPGSRECSRVLRADHSKPGSIIARRSERPIVFEGSLAGKREQKLIVRARAATFALISPRYTHSSKEPPSSLPASHRIAKCCSPPNQATEPESRRVQRHD